MVMFAMLKKFGSGFVRNRRASVLLLVLPAALTAIPTAAQTAEKAAVDHHVDQHVDHFYDPLPQDTGAAGLKLMLRKLNTTGRLMQVDAHPDDEDGGMLTLEARGKGVSTLLMTLTRGEGGQNELGSNLFDVLGVVRTLEVLAADRYYGVEQRFSRVADFGYSKTPEETFQKWQGHDIPLADIVRVIRTFRPDVLIARFSGTERDGHGHHQASAILTKEAFRAAADPNRFPEQIKEGLQPWQPKKLYIGNVCGFGASSCDAANYTVKLNTGKEDPLLGESYVQFAIEGLRHQRSQALGGVSIPKGDRFAYYKMVDSVVESPKDNDGHEQDFFDGIDTTLVGRLGDEGRKIPWLRARFEEIQRKIAAAEQDGNDAATMDAALGEAEGLTASLLVVNGRLSAWYLQTAPYLDSLLAQIKQARALVAGARLEATVDAPVGESPEHAFMAVPGKPFDVTAKLSVEQVFHKRANASIRLRLPKGWKSQELKREQSDKDLSVHFRVSVPATAEITRPYWHRHDPQRDALNIIDEPEYEGLPFPPLPVSAIGDLAGGELSGEEVLAPCMVRYKDASGQIVKRPLAVAPEFSIALMPSSDVIPSGLRGSRTVTTTAGDQSGGSQAQIALNVPNGWRAEPARESVEIPKDDSKDASFQVFPSELKESQTHIRAELMSGKKAYGEGYTVVTREDLGTFYYYQPAVQRVSVVDVKVPKDLKVGYIMGAGDDIPTVLDQIGMNVKMIPADRLASEDLSKYQTIVLGIRAYDTQKDVIANNRRLLNFVQDGGRLVVQYNTLGSFGVPIDFNSGKYTPYPGGLYFMSQWDSNFTPLLESHDPGEAEQKGGLLVAHYGKGTYIYTGYAFFRQLPAGVPGAVRLFVNLVAGR